MRLKEGRLIESSQQKGDALQQKAPSESLQEKEELVEALVEETIPLSQGKARIACSESGKEVVFKRADRAFGGVATMHIPIRTL